MITTNEVKLIEAIKYLVPRAHKYLTDSSEVDRILKMVREIQEDGNADATRQAAEGEMLRALKKASPWLAKLIADGGHENCVMANDAVNTLRLVEDVIKQAERGD